MHPRRILTATATATAFGAAGLLALAAPASAHVSPSVDSGPAGGFLTFALQVPHGCEEAGTTKVEVQIPEGINRVTPQVVPGWTIERTIEQLDPPVDDGHGGQITERTSVVSWTGGPLAHDQLELFGLSVQLPEDEGTILFPTIQTCEDGSTTAWIEETTEGGEEPDHPAPVLEVTAASGDGHGSSDEEATDDAEADLAAAAASNDDGDDDDGSSTGLAVAGLALGALGFATGGAALRRSGRRS